MHFLFFLLGIALIAWGASDVALNYSIPGVQPLIVTYGGAINVAIGFVLMGVGFCIQLLLRMRRAAAASKSTAVPVETTTNVEPAAPAPEAATGPTAAEPTISELPLEDEVEPEPEIEADNDREPEISLEDSIRAAINLEPPASEAPAASTDADVRTEPTIEPAPEPVPEPEPVNANIVQEGEIRGFPFRLYDNGEVAIKTGSGWNVFQTIDEVQSHIAAEMAKSA